jgi:hypothetical protein
VTDLRPRGLAVPALLFAALGALLFGRVLFGGETLIATDFLHASPFWSAEPGPVRNYLLSDTIEHYYPAEVLSSRAAREGRLPLSDPFTFNGMPVPHGVHIWNSVWPVKIAFLLAFDPVRSYDLYAIFHWWLAGVAMTALLRALGASPFAALAGALAYALSARSSAWLHGHYLMTTLAYAPLAFLAVARRSALAPVPVAGLFFTNPHGGLAVAAALLLLDRRSWRTSLAGLLMAGVALVPLAGVVLGGTRDPVEEAASFYQEKLRCWGLLLDFFHPGLVRLTMTRTEYAVYFGLLPLAGALAGARRREYWTWLAVLPVAAATLWPLPVWLAPVSFSLPTRYLFLSTLACAVLFARALDARALRPWARTAVLVLVAIDLAPRFLAHNRPYDPAPLRERPPVADLLRGPGRVGYELSDHPQMGGRPVTPPLALLGIPSVQGYSVMVPKEHARALEGAGEVRGDRLVRLTDPEHRALDALGLRWFVSDRPFAAKRFRPLPSPPGLFVYENPDWKDAPPREPRRDLLWIGLAVTWLGCAGAVLDRLRGRGYS